MGNVLILEYRFAFSSPLMASSKLSVVFALKNSARLLFVNSSRGIILFVRTTRVFGYEISITNTFQSVLHTECTQGSLKHRIIGITRREGSGEYDKWALPVTRLADIAERKERLGWQKAARVATIVERTKIRRRNSIQRGCKNAKGKGK